MCNQTDSECFCRYCLPNHKVPCRLQYSVQVQIEVCTHIIDPVADVIEDPEASYSYVLGGTGISSTARLSRGARPQAKPSW